MNTRWNIIFISVMTATSSTLNRRITPIKVLVFSDLRNNYSFNNVLPLLEAQSNTTLSSVWWRYQTGLSLPTSSSGTCLENPSVLYFSTMQANDGCTSKFQPLSLLRNAWNSDDLFGASSATCQVTCDSSKPTKPQADSLLFLPLVCWRTTLVNRSWLENSNFQ